MTGSYERLAAVCELPDSRVAWTGTSPLHAEGCGPVPEEGARQVHPALFEWLDAQEPALPAGAAQYLE